MQANQSSFLSLPSATSASLRETRSCSLGFFPDFDFFYFKTNPINPVNPVLFFPSLMFTYRRLAVIYTACIQGAFCCSKGRDNSGF